MSESTSELPLEFEFSETAAKSPKKTARKTAVKKVATKKAATKKTATKKTTVKKKTAAKKVDDVPVEAIAPVKKEESVAKEVKIPAVIKVPAPKLEDEVPARYSSDDDYDETPVKKPVKDVPVEGSSEKEIREPSKEEGHNRSQNYKGGFQKKDRFNKKKDFQRNKNYERKGNYPQNNNQQGNKPQNQNKQSFGKQNQKNPNRKNKFSSSRVRADAFGAEEGVFIEVGSLPNYELFSDFDALNALAQECSKKSTVFYNDLAVMPLMDLVAYANEHFSIQWKSAPVRQQLIEAVFDAAAEQKVAIEVEGIIETNEEGYGLIVYEHDNYRIKPLNAFVASTFIKRFGLKRGHIVRAQMLPARKDDEENNIFGETTPYAIQILSIMGKAPEENLHVVPFEDLTPYYPLERLLLETKPDVPWDNISMRTVDLLTPIGKGQRGLIVAPPRTGKTVLQQGIANAILENNPEAHLIILLVDERPEEVTDFRRQIKRGEVIASTFDETPESHVHAAEMVIAKARCMVEAGQHVVILLDSITRLARAYNALAANSGKILSGGVEANALQRPKRFFGSARNIEGGGSLTILGTALVETGSRMDEVIFEEFKGTGNMELHLDRALIDKRIFPAISLEKSGTRKEELLYHPDEMRKVYGLRRAMKGVPSTEAMEMLIHRIKKTKTNAEFLVSLQG
ncbi:MAG: transcription termination factor Rho [Opitutales bacterium]|nr:transcription termination factor Rho [Opitutales bacterium]